MFRKQIRGQAKAIIDVCLPIFRPAGANNGLKQLLDVACPFLDPFGFPSDSKNSTCALSLEGPYFISANAFGEPDGSRNWDSLA